MEAIDQTGFTEDQRNYLSGFVAGILQARELPFLGQDAAGRFTHLSQEAVTPTVYGTPLDDL